MKFGAVVSACGHILAANYPPGAVESGWFFELNSFEISEEIGSFICKRLLGIWVWFLAASPSTEGRLGEGCASLLWRGPIVFNLRPKHLEFHLLGISSKKISLLLDFCFYCRLGTMVTIILTFMFRCTNFLHFYYHHLYLNIHHCPFMIFLHKLALHHAYHHYPKVSNEFFLFPCKPDHFINQLTSWILHCWFLVFCFIIACLVFNT